MLKRPKPGEDEDDILRMQEEFLREKSKDGSFKPSAQVVNLRRTEHQTTKRSSNEASTRKPSKYAQSKGLTQNEKRPKNEPSTSVMGDILEKNVTDVQEIPKDEDDKVYFPKVIPALLGEIVEKNLDKFVDFNEDPMPSKGFPAVPKRNPTIVPGKKSIHALQMEKNKQRIKKEEKSTKMDVDDMAKQNTQAGSSQSVADSLNLPSKSYILANKEADVIHNENVQVLSKLSEKEILDEQEKLLSSLDPKLVEFIKARRKQTPATESAPTKNKKEEEMETEDISSNQQNDESDELWDNDILSHPDASQWLHFDSLEKDKLQWMKGVQESKMVKPDEPYEARFDFKGYLLPYTMEYTEKTKTLFHHGEEPHRPGYSLTELIELSRSSVTQQRVMALNTIAGILDYYHTGIYKDIIEIPLTKICFVLRFAMEENKVITLEPALKAMRNLLYNKVDEACLDALIGFEEGTFQPCLENDKSEIEEMDSKESELKDFHLGEIDLVAAILRTNILQRLYYITDTIKPSFNCVQYSLQILTRLARDSVETASTIVQTGHLMNTIIKNFMPTTSINFTFNPDIVYNGKPVLAALKLVRILSLQSKEIGEILISKYNILEPVSEYINSGIDGTYGLKLQMEAYCILSNLLHYDLAVNQAVALFPVIVTTLYKHVQGTDIFISTLPISSTHAAVVLQLVNRMFNCNFFDVEKYGHKIYPLVKEGLTKWIAQVASIDNYTCGHMRVVCSVLDCCKTILVKTQASLEFLNNALKSLSKSKGMMKIMANLVSSSNLLSGIEEKDLNFTKNLTCLGGAVIDSAQKVLPILNITSPMPFLVSLFKVLVNINDKEIADSYIELVQPYLRRLINKTPSLTLNWFTRMEIDFVFNTVWLSLQSNITEKLKDIVYAVANKLCFILRIDKQFELHYLFNNIIFNKEWFTAERLFHLVSLSEADGFSKVLSSIEDIKLCYSKVVNVNNLDRIPNIVLRIWKEPILPRDWIYLPILSLYSKSQEMPATPMIVGDHAVKLANMAALEKELIVTCSLEWILFNELCFPDLINDIHVTDRFCRIMCVFLCDNSLFLDEKIKLLLHRCTKILFKKASDFNFDKQLIGLSNFENFYTQLLEHFQSVSYGDYNFSACVLVPLAQHHNVKWRKILWSEYAGCLRALDCPENYLCYEINKYLSPEETDDSLIKCYFRALSSNLLGPGTIVHRIATHHAECYKQRMNVSEP
ncbi:RNA polymerase II-associated protein 1 [Epargyreus clarus]|uniref:RNA polymerase II-associated protein 1 n=1 Tax=Epargyreus clarus TaxID=520877 RepID=UPI003C2AED05